jgi:hypothetical protein
VGVITHKQVLVVFSGLLLAMLTPDLGRELVPDAHPAD